MSRRRSPLWNATVLDKLRSSLLFTYDKFARPAQPGNATRVLVDWTLRHVDLDEQQATLTVNGWLRLNWLDEKLRWTPMDFDGVTQVHVASHEIWQPDIVLYNSGGAGGALDYYGNTQCVVKADGTVLWVPPFEFAAPCALDLTRWPYDVQTCQLELGSWTYDGDELDLQLGEHVEHELLVHSNEWQVQDVQRTRRDGRAAWSDETRITLIYDLVLARRATAYAPIVLTPVFVIVVMTLLTFWLPPNAGEKLILHVGTVIIVCMLVLHVGHKCAGGGGARVPLLLLFYNSILYVVTCSFVGSVCVLCVSRTHHRRPLPTVLRRTLHGRWARWLVLDVHTHATLTHGDELQTHDDDSVSDRQGILLTNTNGAECSSTYTDTDWLLLAAAIDRISFIFYTILFAILAIFYAI